MTDTYMNHENGFNASFKLASLAAGGLLNHFTTDNPINYTDKGSFICISTEVPLRNAMIDSPSLSDHAKRLFESPHRVVAMLLGVTSVTMNVLSIGTVWIRIKLGNHLGWRLREAS